MINKSVYNCTSFFSSYKILIKFLSDFILFPDSSLGKDKGIVEQKQGTQGINNTELIYLKIQLWVFRFLCILVRRKSLRRGCGRYETRSCFGLFLAVALPDNFLLDDISPGRKCQEMKVSVLGIFKARTLTLLAEGDFHSKRTLDSSPVFFSPRYQFERN